MYLFSIIKRQISVTILRKQEKSKNVIRVNTGRKQQANKDQTSETIFVCKYWPVASVVSASSGKVLRKDLNEKKSGCGSVLALFLETGSGSALQ
jgi:hypothetical protein